MRKHIYRVWSGDTWLDGNDANINPVNPDDTDIELKACYPHAELIMCEWTGLVDKHKKKIFEGDIVKVKAKMASSKSEMKERIGKMIYSDLGWPDWCAVIENKKDKCFDYSANIDISSIKIIGNIYENPELLDIS